MTGKRILQIPNASEGPHAVYQVWWTDPSIARRAGRMVHFRGIGGGLELLACIRQAQRDRCRAWALHSSCFSPKRCPHVPANGIASDQDSSLTTEMWVMSLRVKLGLCPGFIASATHCERSPGERSFHACRFAAASLLARSPGKFRMTGRDSLLIQPLHYRHYCRLLFSRRY